MELLYFKVTGFGRFRETATLNFSNRVLCIVGPNEAGKTTLLRGFKHLEHDRPITESHDPFGETPASAELEWRFRISDKETLELGLPNGPYDLVVSKTDGPREYRLDPPFDLNRHRIQCARELTRFYSESQHDGVKESHLQRLAELATVLSDVAEPIELRHVAELKSILRPVKDYPRIATDLELLVRDHAQIAAQNYLPRVEVFQPGSYRLRERYKLDAVVNPPPPLVALAKLCSLDLRAIAEQMSSASSKKAIGERADEQLRIASHRLTLSNTECALEIQADHIAFLIREVGADPPRYTRLSIRSDGFQQYLSMALFVVGQPGTVPPIVLVDELERHLHYDAQADVVSSLEGLLEASGVVYTTHSLGCLPSDWSGLKVVRKSNAVESTIENKYWSMGAGFSPLLQASGAVSVAFLPLRPALLVEGATDALLLPALFRQACGLRDIAFSVVPGLTNAPEIPRLTREGSSFQCCVDTDDSGRRIAAAFEQEYGPDLVHFYSSDDGVELEDFVHVDVLATAVFRYLLRYDPVAERVPATLLEGSRRGMKLKDLLKSRGVDGGKADVAYEVLNLARENPSLQIVEPSRAQELKELYQTIADGFGGRKLE